MCAVECNIKFETLSIIFIPEIKNLFDFSAPSFSVSETQTITEVSYGEILVDEIAVYIRVTSYCGHLIIL